MVSVSKIISLIFAFLWTFLILSLKWEHFISLLNRSYLFKHFINNNEKSFHSKKKCTLHLMRMFHFTLILFMQKMKNNSSRKRFPSPQLISRLLETSLAQDLCFIWLLKFEIWRNLQSCRVLISKLKWSERKLAKHFSNVQHEGNFKLSLPLLRSVLEKIYRKNLQFKFSISTI